MKKPTKSSSNSIKKPQKASADKKSFAGPTFLITAITVVALGCIIYSNSFDCSFHLDDNPCILMNSTIRNLSDVQALWEMNSSRFFGNLSIAVNYHYGRYEVYGYHLFNLSVHLLNACLIFLLTIQLFKTPVMRNHSLASHSRSFAFFMALLFVSHPLATGSVTYIIQRFASMVTLFYLLSVWSFMRARFAQKISVAILYFSLSTMAALAAFTTKENSFTLPIALVLIELFFFRENIFSDKKNVKYWLMAVAVTGIVVTFAIFRFSTSIFKTIEPELGNTYTLTSSTYFMTQFSVILKYIQLLFVPVGLNLDYDWPIAQHITEPRTLLSLIALLGLLSLAVYLFKRNRLVSFGIFWFFLTLSIESSIVPISDVIFEHRTYLPMFGFLLVLLSLVFTYVWKKNSFSGAVILTGIVFGYSSMTYARNKVWKTDETLWLDVVKKSPGKARPKVNLGKYYIDHNEHQKAYPLFIDAEKINPNYFDAAQNSGVCELVFERFDEAIAHFNKALRLNPSNVRAHYAMGLSYLGKEEWTTAIPCFTDALKYDSTYTRAFAKRGYAYGSISNWDAALKDYDKACLLDPGNAQYFYERGNIFGINKNYNKAIENYNKAIFINPNTPDGYLYRAISYENLEQWGKALADYETVLRMDPANKLANAKKSGIEAYFKSKNLPLPK
ncbi:MAG: tetratricopeptide repeat protein [Bacteroidota bacterium]